MREKVFIPASNEDIVNIYITQSQGIIVEVGMGEDVDGIFVPLAEQNYERYQFTNESFETNTKLKKMISDFKDEVFQYVDSTRTQIEQERALKKNIQ